MLSVLGLALGLGMQPAAWQALIFPALALLLMVTTVKRVGGALQELRR
jgi:hypothetical protein